VYIGRAFWHALVVLLVIVGLATPAHAHTAGPEFVSVFETISPPAPGIRVSLRSTGSAPQLTIEGHRSHTFEVSGLEGEPLALINSDGAFVNELSSSAYLVREPGSAPRRTEDSAGAQQLRWKLVSRELIFQYHEPRAEWPHTGPPPDVERVGRRATILRWEIPSRYDGNRVAIKGRVDWTPQGLNFEVFLFAGALVMLVFWWMEPRIGHWVQPIRRGLAVVVFALFALETIRVTADAFSEGGSWASLAVLPALLLVAFSIPLIWRGDRRGYGVAVVFGGYAALVGLAELSGLRLYTTTWIAWVQSALGLLAGIGGGLMIFVTRQHPGVAARPEMPVRE
jgi:hypothetical protein